MATIRQEIETVLLNSEDDPAEVVSAAMHVLVEFACSELDMTQEDLHSLIDLALADEG